MPPTPEGERFRTSFNLEFWQAWEGRSVESAPPLQRLIREIAGGAAFETQFQGRSAVIKLFPGTADTINEQLQSWESAADLSHPALVQILGKGKTGLGDAPCAYVVSERPEENLADVLTDRPLTSAETHDMLAALLGVLQYLESKGFAHGGLEPANIMAFGDQLKISSDAVVRGGDLAESRRAIGVLLQQVLGSAETDRLPSPFDEIARNCLNPDPAARWSLARIEACLRGDPAPPAQAGSRRTGVAVAAAAALVLALGAIWLTQEKKADLPAPRKASVSPPPQPSPKPSAATKPASGSAQLHPPKQPSPVPVAPPASRTQSNTERVPAAPGGITQVMPEIPPPARSTISGKVRINVRVRVDDSGKVIQARPEPPLASKYLTERVLAAARAWKFPAGGPPQDWVLRFELAREQTRVVPEKTGNLR